MTVNWSLFKFFFNYDSSLFKFKLFVERIILGLNIAHDNAFLNKKAFLVEGLLRHLIWVITWILDVFYCGESIAKR